VIIVGTGLEWQRPHTVERMQCDAKSTASKAGKRRSMCPMFEHLNGYDPPLQHAIMALISGHSSHDDTT
jgi:hypothetical protein